MNRTIHIKNILLPALLLLGLTAGAQRKGLVSSDQLLKMAITETNTHRNYPKAIALCRKALSQSPDYPDVHLLLGRLYLLTGQPADARTEWLQVLKKQPAQADALHYLINLEYSQRRIPEAIRYIDVALRPNPASKPLLLKKYGMLQESGQRAAQENVLHQLLAAWPNDEKVRALQQEYREEQERIRRAQQPLVIPAVAKTPLPARPRPVRKAAPVKQKARHEQVDMDVQLQRINAFVRTNRTDSAIALINTLLAQRSADTFLLFKQSGLLESQQQYQAAAALSRQLMALHPASNRYRQAYIDQLMGAARASLKNNEPAAAQPLLQEVVRHAPDNRDAWNYLINLEAAAGNYAPAAALCDSALLHTGSDPALLRKKSALLQQSGRYTEAAVITAQLLQQSPNDTLLQRIYADQLIARGRGLQQANDWEGALAVFKTAYDHARTDTLLLQQLINSHLALQQYDSALAYTDQALRLSPRNPALLMKRTAALEALHRYREAAAGVAMLQQLQPDNAALQRHHDWLQSRGYRNQAGVIHLQSLYDNGNRTASVTSLQYLRYHQRGSIIGRVNYANRAGGDGIQLEAETYYTHNKRYYSYGLLGWSNAEVFPRFRAGYSLFRSFNKEWEGELGARYLRSDSVNTWSAVFSAGKYWGSYWANLRGYVIHEQDNWYQAYTLTNRFYLREQQDYIALVLGAGNPPDDRSRNFRFNSYAAYFSTTVGLGYQKTFRYRTTVGLFGNWINQRTAGKRIYNQYDIYVTLLHKF